MSGKRIKCVETKSWQTLLILEINKPMELGDKMLYPSAIPASGQFGWLPHLSCGSLALRCFCIIFETQELPFIVLYFLLEFLPVRPKIEGQNHFFPDHIISTSPANPFRIVHWNLPKHCQTGIFHKSLKQWQNFFSY